MCYHLCAEPSKAGLRETEGRMVAGWGRRGAGQVLVAIGRKVSSADGARGIVHGVSSSVLETPGGAAIRPEVFSPRKKKL